MQKQIRKNQAKRRQKELAVVMALVNGLNTTAPLVLPLTAVVPETPKSRQETIDNLLATSFNRGGQLLDRLFFATAYAGDTITGNKNVSAGTADGDVIENNGNQYVYDTGSATNTTVNSGGEQVVSSGGRTSNTTITSGGEQHIYGGGIDSNSTIHSGGVQTMSGGGIASGATVSGGQSVLNGGSAISATITSGGTQYVSSGGSSTDTTVQSGGRLYLATGGNATDTTLEDGYVLQANTDSILGTTTAGAGIAGKKATGLTLNRNGSLEVLSDGSADGTIINSSGTQRVSGGGNASGTIINSDGRQIVFGTVSSTAVNNGGREDILEGARSYGTKVYAGGLQAVNGSSGSAAVATSTVVSSGGTQDVGNYGSAVDTLITEGGRQYVRTGGSATGTEINGGRQDVYGSDTGATIIGNGTQHVYDSGSATGTIIYAGFQHVSSGGHASGTTIHDGNQTVSGGGQAFHTTISGGTQEVKTNARAYNTTISNGNQNLSGSSSLAEITVIHSGGTQEVGSIAVAHRTTISTGGRQIFNEGFARNTIIDSGGVQELDNGNADLTTILAGGVQNIISAGAATNTTIHSGGVQNVYYGGIAGGQTEISSDVTLDGSLFLASGTLFSGGTTISGGTQNVLGGSADGTVILSGGTQAVSSGSATNTTIHNGGTQSVYRGTMVSNSTVNAGGVINLVQSGAALQGDTTLNQGTVQIFNPVNGSYEISRLVVNGGGTVRLATGTVGNRLTLDDLQGAASFIINTDLANNTSDKIEIKSSTNASGSTIQVAFDPGFASGSAISGTALFSTVEAGDAGFTAIPTDWGAYRFTPTISSSAGAGGQTDWLVTGLNTADGNPGVSETMLTASDVITNNLALWRTENNSLLRRMGELRNAPGQAGAWARVYRGETETANPGSRATKATYTAIQGGYDKKHSGYQGGTLYAGYTVGYLDASIGFNRGGGDASSLSIGAYGSWLGDKGHFLDLIAKQGRLKNSYENYLNNPSNTKVTGSYHNWGTSLSAEYGFRQQRGGGWYVEPQAEITLGRAGSASYTTSDGTRVHNRSMNSTVGRLGLAVGRSLADSTFYAKASIVREFSARSRITMSTGGLAPVTLEQDLKDTWLEFALGITGPLNERTSGYLEITRTNGDTVKTPWLVNLGARWKF